MFQLERPKLTRPPDWRTLDRLKKEDVQDVSVQMVAHYDKTDQIVSQNTMALKQLRAQVYNW